MKITNIIPKFIRGHEQSSKIGKLKKLMDEMEVGQVAIISKKEWGIKTKPFQTWQSYRTQKNLKHTFSGRQDDKNYYLMKVKFPISVEGEPIKRVWEGKLK